MGTREEAEEANVLVCSGKRGGRLYSDGSGYFYKKNQAKSDTLWSMKCMHNTCKGSASMTISHISESQNSLKHIGKHNCEPDPLFASVTALRKSILNRAKAENTKLSQIFKEECNR